MRNGQKMHAKAAAGYMATIEPQGYLVFPNTVAAVQCRHIITLDFGVITELVSLRS